MAIRGIPSLPPVAWAVPPSPARDIRFVFRAFADPGPDRTGVGLKGDKLNQKIVQICALLCTTSYELIGNKAYDKLLSPVLSG